MTYKLKILEKKDEMRYAFFLNKNRHFLWYASLEYKKLLESYLAVKSIYFLVYRDRDIVGCLPLMKTQDNSFGAVINSLPYYGSNGCFLLQEGLKKRETKEIMNILLKKVNEYTSQENIVALTFITSPFDKFSKEFIEENYEYTFSDYRIGQITPLPTDPTELIKIFDNPRPRNIRKAIKSGVTVRWSKEKEDYEFLVSTHQKNMKFIGGKYKSRLFFEKVRLEVPQQSKALYIAEYKGKKIAALLLFFYNDTVEYFTPCSLNEFRNLQASSYLIYYAMKAAIEKKYKFWNWGGTWESQKGVYDFKKKWGAIDKKYYYFSKIMNPEIYNFEPEDLMNMYPSFYTYPFNKLKKL